MYSIVNQLYTYTYPLFFLVFSHIVITVCWVEFPVLYRRSLLVICFMCVCVLSHFSRVQLFVDPVDCSPPGSSVRGMQLRQLISSCPWMKYVCRINSKERILEWVAVPSSKGFSWPRDPTSIFCVSWIAGGFFITEPSEKPLYLIKTSNTWGTKNYSVQFSRSVVFDSLRPRELQHSRPPCPSPTPGFHSKIISHQ